MADPTERILMVARARLGRAERAVGSLEVDIGRQKQALAAKPSPEGEAMLGRFEAALARRIAERDQAREEFAELESLPRWRLELWLMTRRRSAKS
jgi:hypothetical protein